MIRLASARTCSRLAYTIQKSYVRQAVIDDICKDYGDGWKDKIKMYTKKYPESKC